MNPAQNIKPYDLTRGEKIVHGSMAGLEIICNRLAFELETFFFDQFSIPFKIDYKVDKSIKFRHFLENITPPKPIYIFQMNPLKGDALFVLENRFANLFLAKEQLLRDKKILVKNNFQITNENYALVQLGVSKVLQVMQESWAKFLPVEIRFKKLVSHRMKAKVMSPFETCIVITLNLQWQSFETKFQFCFSYQFLDPIMKIVARRDLLASESKSQINPDVEEHFYQVLQGIPYEARGVLGKIQLSKKELIENLETGLVIPIKNGSLDNTVLTVNDVPLLVGEIGTVEDKYSIQLKAKYGEQTPYSPGTKVFKKLNFKKN